jgi:hypothetical protein
VKSGAKIEWMSWSKCREAEVTDGTAVIWILNPDMKPVQRRTKHELTVTFWDRSALPPGDFLIAALFGRWPSLCCTVRRVVCGDNGGWPWRPPLSHDADAIHKFVDGLPDTIVRVLVACEFGQSRSRAVAEWMAAATAGIAIGDASKGLPNSRLSDLLFSA